MPAAGTPEWLKTTPEMGSLMRQTAAYKAMVPPWPNPPKRKGNFPVLPDFSTESISFSSITALLASPMLAPSICCRASISGPLSGGKASSPAAFIGSPSKLVSMSSRTRKRRPSFTASASDIWNHSKPVRGFRTSTRSPGWEAERRFSHGPCSSGTSPAPGNQKRTCVASPFAAPISKATGAANASSTYGMMRSSSMTRSGLKRLPSATVRCSFSSSFCSSSHSKKSRSQLILSGFCTVARSCGGAGGNGVPLPRVGPDRLGPATTWLCESSTTATPVTS
mmetsp:Transcript_8564/g.23236  ORF Transcript_8564/g.23236 Transcript_8564/m.23236 type:complete len:280 (+) Transcript_8564:509-1348(+)